MPTTEPPVEQGSAVGFAMPRDPALVVYTDERQVEHVCAALKAGDRSHYLAPMHAAEPDATYTVRVALDPLVYCEFGLGFHIRAGQCRFCGRLWHGPLQPFALLGGVPVPLSEPEYLIEYARRMATVARFVIDSGATMAEFVWRYLSANWELPPEPEPTPAPPPERSAAEADFPFGDFYPPV
jgi:hypothetical protein